MLIVSNGDNLHEISKSLLSGINKKIIIFLSSADFAQGEVKVKHTQQVLRRQEVMLGRYNPSVSETNLQAYNKKCYLYLQINSCTKVKQIHFIYRIECVESSYQVSSIFPHSRTIYKCLTFRAKHICSRRQSPVFIRREIRRE